jgi:hypothetical protein
VESLRLKSEKQKEEAEERVKSLIQGAGVHVLVYFFFLIVGVGISR